MTIIQKSGGFRFILTGLLIVLATGIRAETNAPSTLAAQLAAIHAQGFPTSIAELEQWRYSSATGTNATDLYRQAFAQLVRPSKENTKQLPVIGIARWPAHQTPLSDEMRAAIRDYLSTNGAALEILQRAADLPATGYSRGTNELIAAFMKDDAQTRAAARLLSMQATFAAINDHPDEAVKALRAAFRLTRPLDACAPLLIKYLVTRAVQMTALSAFQQIVQRVPLTDTQLTAVEETLREEENAVQIQTALIGDRAFAIDRFKSLTLTNLEAEESAFLTGMDGYIAAAALGYPERSQALLGVEKQIVSQTNLFPKAGLILQTIQGPFRRDARYTAEFRVAHAVIAIERERLKNHALPEMLPAAILPDPYDGKPLHYKKLATGYVVYSIGDNLLDDGGDQKKDIIFSVER